MLMLSVMAVMAAGLLIDCPAYAGLPPPEPGAAFEYSGQSGGVPARLRETVLAVERNGLRIHRDLALGGGPFSPLGEEVSVVGSLLAVSREGSSAVFVSARIAERIERLAQGRDITFTLPGPHGERDITVRFEGCVDGPHGRESVYQRWYDDDREAAVITHISHQDGWWISRQGDRTSFTRD
jgi:hypothetical protein